MAQILKFIGSGAAEGIPSPFCRCPICENARSVKGKEIKTRTTFRVTDEVQIDLNSDAFIQSILYQNDLFTLKHLLVTHTHNDHFLPFELFLREMSFQPPEHPLTVYLTAEAFAIVDAMDSLCRQGEKTFAQQLMGIVQFKQLEFHHTYSIGDTVVTPYRGAHTGFMEPYSALYYIQLPTNKTLLYALDTGYFPEETFECLAGKQLDYLIIEGTFGDADRGEKPYGHLDLYSLDNVLDKLYQTDAITGESSVYVTHMNHKHSFTHQDLEEYYENHPHQYDICIAYDGLRIEA